MAQDPVIELLKARIDARAAEGMKTYGCGMDRSDYTMKMWLENALEEALDQAAYLQAALYALDHGRPG